MQHMHIVFLVPLLALALFIFLPFSQALIVYLPILLACLFFFWMAWRDAHRPVTLGMEGMIGGIAKVIESETGRVKVFYRGEIWDAICAESVSKDEKVEITAVEEMKLVVRRQAQ